MKRKYIVCIKHIIMIIVLSCVSLFQIVAGARVSHRLNANPHLLEMQKLLDEQAGESFQVVLNYEKQERIASVTLSASEELYRSKNIFEKVDQAQKLIFRYITEHGEAFDFSCEIYDDMGDITNQPFILRFENKDRSHGRETVFWFQCTDEWQESRIPGFDSMGVQGEVSYTRNDMVLYYKISDLCVFTNLRELQCDDVLIDDAQVVGGMKQWKKIYLGRCPGSDADLLRKKGEKLGIEVIQLS